MSHYSTAKRPEIEIGSEHVVVRGKYSTTTARILRDETIDGERRVTLDRLLDRHPAVYVELLDDRRVCEWQAAGAFVSVLKTSEASDDD